MMVNTTHEIVINGATYTTKKMTPPLRGRITQVSGHLMRAAVGMSTDDLKNPDSYPDWLKVIISGALWIHLPEIMWDFIRPEDKTKIGTQENFNDALTDEMIGSFYAWANANIEQANELVKKTPEMAVSEPPSTSLKTSSAESTDGAGITSSP